MIDSAYIGTEYWFKMTFKMPNDWLNELLKYFMVDSVNINSKWRLKRVWDFGHRTAGGEENILSRWKT